MSGVMSDSCMPYSSQLALVSGLLLDPFPLPLEFSRSALHTAHRWPLDTSVNTERLIVLV